MYWGVEGIFNVAREALDKYVEKHVRRALLLKAREVI